MEAVQLLPQDVMLDRPFFFKAEHQVETPTSSADEADLNIKNVIKSPLAKHDQISAAKPSPSDSETSAGPPAVDSRPEDAAASGGVVDQPLPIVASYAPPIPAPAAISGPDPWLMGLFTSSLFEPAGCRCHPGTVRNGNLKRNENNQYCLSCTHAHGTGMCKLCLQAHAACCPGRVFQIRKYMYQTCVHVDDIQPLYDVSGVQAYCINSRRAVLIHPKNVEKEQKCPAFDHTCMGCHKPLRHDCTYCSLRCKVDVEFGLAPITPRGAATAACCDSDMAPAAAAAAMLLSTQARQQSASRLASTKRQTYAVAAPPLPLCSLATLDVSHATLCSSGCEAGSIRSKRRKTDRPERSHIS